MLQSHVVRKTIVSFGRFYSSGAQGGDHPAEGLEAVQGAADAEQEEEEGEEEVTVVSSQQLCMKYSFVSFARPGPFQWL